MDVDPPAMLDPDLLADVKRVRRQLIDELLEMQELGGYWTGELSTSALSTATTCVAFNELCKAGVTEAGGQPLRPLINGGLQWLIDNVNDDGGWGDTTKSKSNISTTTLCRAAIAARSTTQSTPQDAVNNSAPEGGTPWTEGKGVACGETGPLSPPPDTPTPVGVSPDVETVLQDADAWIANATREHSSLSAAIVARYGKDKTFSVPILMQCALAGVVDWKEIPRLPFELAVLPHRFYAAVKLPVVSYALPALIAIGQLLHFKNPTWFLPLRWMRSASVNHTLKKLASLQPSNGGFLEAAPLTGFVTMALAATGRANHLVAQKGAEFLVNSVRPDGSWPIDTNLSTWVTTLIVNALGDSARDELPNPDATLRWLLDQQHTEVHPFTNAAPGGWAWTPLPGGVPDADDTAGAIRALMYLRPRDEDRAKPTTRPVVPTSESAQTIPFAAREGNASAEPLTRTHGLNQESPVRDQPPANEQGSSTAEDTPRSADLRVGTERPDHPNDSSPPDALGLRLTTTKEVDKAAANGLRWLASLQNRDGGIPTFCKGWGTLPFDRSSCDITAHAISAARAYCAAVTSDVAVSAATTQTIQFDHRQNVVREWFAESQSRSTWTGRELPECRSRKLVRYLVSQRGKDGSWRPLWFGNQYLRQEENPIYGTSRVLIAMQGRRDSCYADFPTSYTYAKPSVDFLIGEQLESGGLGGGENAPATVEETSVACEALSYRVGDVNAAAAGDSLKASLRYLITAIDQGDHRDPQPIGFYFAKLWYFEKLYPYTFALGALQAVVDAFDAKPS